MKRFISLVLSLLLTAFSVKAQQSASLVWTKGMGGTGDDRGWCITVDTSGNVYTTGVFQESADFDPGPAVFNLTSAGGYDIFIQKLGADGNFLWAKRVGGTNWDEGYGIAVDNSGNVYSTGYFCDTVDFDSGPDTFNMISAGHGDIFVQKLNSAGNLVWAKRMGGIRFDFGGSLAVDTSGNVYTTGVFSSDTVDFDPGPGTFNLISAGGWDIFVQKLDTYGNFVWAKRMGGVMDDWGQSIAVDAVGNIYTTGFFQDTVDFDPGPAVFNLTSAGGYDIFIQKLDTDGNLIWAKSMGGPSIDWGKSMVVDSSGSVYITGGFQGTADFDPSPGTVNLTSIGNTEIFVLKLDTDGNLIWAKSMGGTDDNYGYSIAVDAPGNIYTTGVFSGTANFDPGSGTVNLNSAGNYDVFVTKWSQGTPVINNAKQFEPCFFVRNSSPRLLRYALPDQCLVRVRYYDMKGRLVATIVNQVQKPGNYSIIPPATQWATGVYVQVFKAGSFVKSERVMVVR